MIPRWIRAAGALLLTSLAPTAEADDFDDFRIPAHQVTDWTANLQAGANRSLSSATGVSSRFRVASGGGGSFFRWLSDSDPTLTGVSLDAFASGSGQWSSSDIISSIARSVSADENRGGDEGWRASVTHRRYPWATPIGLSLSATGTGDYRQSWEHREAQSTTDNGVTRTEVTSRSRSQQWIYRTSAFVDLMAGWGRVRDATGVYDAVVLEERLRQAGVIGRELSAGARRRLAALMVVRSAYSSVHQRPSKDLWEEIATILRADGPLGENGLDAEAAFRAAEAYLGAGITSDGLPRSPVRRQVGVFAGPWLSVQSQNSVLRLDSGSFLQQTLDGVPDPAVVGESHFRSSSSLDEVLGGVSAEVHRPLGARWQLDASGRAGAQLRSQDDGFEADLDGSVAWMLADHWMASAFAFYRRRVNQEPDGGPTREDSWQTQLGARGTWFIEDRLQLDVRLQELQGHDQPPFAPQNQRYGVVTVGLTYRLLGSFQTPDLGLGGRLP